MKTFKLLNSKRSWLASIPVMIVMIFCVVAGEIAGHDMNRFYDISVADIDSGWISEKGEEFKLSEMPYGNITVERSVEGIVLTNKRLCMKSIDTFFEVLADGELIYHYYPELPPILGESYGMYIHAVPIPDDTNILTVKLTPIYANAPPALLNTVIEDPGMFMGDLFKEGISGFCLCLLMLTMGIGMIIIGLFSYRTPNNQPIEFFTLGFFGVLVAVWSVNDTLVLQTLTQNPAMIRLLNYVSLMFLPYFIVTFIASAANNPKTILLPILFVSVCINFVLNISLTTLGISDYYDLVKISQAIIVAALCMAIYLIVSAIRQNRIERRFLLVLISGICVLGIGATIDLVRFRVTTNVIQGTSFYARMGTLIFIGLIGIYLIRENSRIQIEHRQELAQLAYTDRLTGLKNRLAFNEAEASILKNPDARCTIIQFDVNNLKKVNDMHGHFEGDRHISGAASIIRDCIKGSGDCYRTGGDEFIAIITGTDDESAAQNAIDQMKIMIQEYNSHEKPPILLSIAYGMAPFRASEGSLEKAEQLADQRMYECKSVQKSNMTLGDT